MFMLYPSRLWFLLGAILTILSSSAQTSDKISSNSFLSVQKSSSNDLIIQAHLKPYIEHQITIDEKQYYWFDASLSGQTYESGKPLLPIEGTLIALPPGKRAIAEIIESNFEIHENQYVAPAPKYTLDENNEAVAEYYLDNHFYETYDQFYPTQLIELSDEHYIRDQRVVKLNIFAFHCLELPDD